MKNPIRILLLAAMLAGCSTGDSWYDSVIPVTLRGIETVHIDNSGEFPAVSGAPIKKEAYMVGIKWIVDNTPTSGDKFITGPILKGEQTYGSISDRYAKAIRCNTQFNASVPAGTYVSKFFKEINRNYLPAEVDEGFVLLVAPDPGTHSFTVEFYEGTQLRFSYDTPPVNLF